MRAKPIAAAALILASGVAGAQTLRSEASALVEAKRQAAAASQRAAALELAAQRASDAAARVRAAKAAVAARILAAESDIAAAEARIRIVAGLSARQRQRLAARQAPIIRLVAALQTMARRPPALALVQRGSIVDLVHVRALLASQLPLVRARTAGLRAEVAAGFRLQRQAAEAAETLRLGRKRLDDERIALAQLEAQHRARAQGLVDSAMYEEDRAIALGEQARDIVDLMGEIDAQGQVRDRLAALPGPVLRPPVPARMVPPPPQLEAPLPRPRFVYRLPVAGQLVTGLGEVSEAGVRARGLTLATLPHAQVVAPSGGRIAYAGRFRGYGNIVIIDHGGGWTSLVTNLVDLSVGVGDTVDRSSPLGRTHSAKPRVTIELRRRGQPVDIVPLVAAG